MKALITLLLASGIYCRSLKSTDDHQQQQSLKQSDELQDTQAVGGGNESNGNSVNDENIDRNLSSDLIRKLPYDLLIAKMMNTKRVGNLAELNKSMLYRIIKTMQRNKRQSNEKRRQPKKGNYLSLCDFKICNIGGRKRRSPYVHMPKSAYDERDK